MLSPLSRYDGNAGYERHNTPAIAAEASGELCKSTELGEVSLSSRLLLHTVELN
jgi:hypothetical protein